MRDRVAMNKKNKIGWVGLARKALSVLLGLFNSPSLRELTIFFHFLQVPDVSMEECTLSVKFVAWFKWLRTAVYGFQLTHRTSLSKSTLPCKFQPQILFISTWNLKLNVQLSQGKSCSCR